MVKRSRLKKKLFSRKLMRLETFPSVKQIVLTRWEGRTEECMKPVTVKSFAEANKILDAWRATAPDVKGGYHKIGFEVAFGNGDVYKGRYDLNKANFQGYADSPTLEQHMVEVQKEFMKMSAARILKKVKS